MPSASWSGLTQRGRVLQPSKPLLKLYITCSCSNLVAEKPVFWHTWFLSCLKYSANPELQHCTLNIPNKAFSGSVHPLLHILESKQFQELSPVVGTEDLLTGRLSRFVLSIHLQHMGKPRVSAVHPLWLMIPPFRSASSGRRTPSCRVYCWWEGKLPQNRNNPIVISSALTLSW